MSLSRIILNEVIGRPVLYHFTKVALLGRIIGFDLLKTGEYNNSVSFSRSYNAKIIGDDKIDARITIDWNRLKDFYKIETFLYNENIPMKDVPRRFDDTTPPSKHDLRLRANAIRQRYESEREERVMKNIEKLHRFVIQIDILSSKPKEYLDSPLYSTPEKDKNYKIYESIPVNFVTKWEPVKL